MDLDPIEIKLQIADFNREVAGAEFPIFITDYLLLDHGIQFTIFSPKTPVGFPNGAVSFPIANKVDLARCLTMLKRGCGAASVRLGPSEVQWIVNDSAELGVKIGEQCFFYYRGESLTYSGKHDTGEVRKYRPVGTFEFGETINPVIQDDGIGIVGTLPFHEGHTWYTLPQAE